MPGPLLNSLIKHCDENPNNFRCIYSHDIRIGVQTNTMPLNKSQKITFNDNISNNIIEGTPITSDDEFNKISVNSEIPWGGYHTKQRKQLSSNGTRHVNNIIPLIQWIQQTIQNPDNLIHENADIDWVRGGDHSRHDNKYETKVTNKIKHNGSQKVRKQKTK